MIKFLLSSVFLGLFCSAFSVPLYASDNVVDKSFEQGLKELSTPAKVFYGKAVSDVKENAEKKEEDSSYRSDLMNAVLYHNLMNAIEAQRLQLEGFRLAVLDKEITKERVKDFDKCNIGLLSPYFAQPEQVWDKLKAETEEQIENYNLNTVTQAESLSEDNAQLLALSKSLEVQKSLNNPIVQNAKNVDAEGAKKNVEAFRNLKTSDIKGVATSGVTDSEDFSISSQAPEVDITFAILNKFYPYQDKWGKRKSSETSSLPLWEDQKYLYNRDVWKPKYQAIRNHCLKQEVKLALKEPSVSDKVKYDYYFYNELKSAHNAFVRAAQAQKCVLTDGMKEPPQVAPRPLPPVYEEIMVFDDAGVLNSIYPQNPMNPSSTEEGAFIEKTLWEKYKLGNYKDLASNGEFKNYFKVSGSNLRVRSTINEIDGNRLSRYLLYKEEAENAVETYEGFLDAANELKQNVKDATRISTIDFPENLNYLKKADLDRVYNLLKSKKEALLAKVAPYMSGKTLPETNTTTEKRNNNVIASQIDVAIKEARKDAEEKQRNNDTTSLAQEDIDLAYYNALVLDKNAEVKLTEEQAFTITEAIKEARASQELLLKLNENSNMEKLDKLQGSKTEKGKNYKADTSNCLKQTKVRLLDINKVVIE